MAGQKTISTAYLPPLPPPPPPPAPFLIVSGTLNPDATGNYAYKDEYGGKHRYKKLTTDFVIYWDPTHSVWFLTDHPGEEGLGGWFKAGTEVTGEYEPGDPYEGTVTIIWG